MSDRPHSGNLYRVAAALAVAVLLAGCGDGNEVSNKTAAEGKASARGRAGDVALGDLVDNALDMLQPERLTVSSDQAAAAAVLNDWLAAARTQQPELSSEPPAELLEKLPDATRERLLLSGFGSRDSEHIRTALLLRSIVRRELSEARGDVGRVTGLFDFIMRSVVLVPEDGIGYPRSVFEILLFGQGTAADRSWAFCDATRQMRIETVLVQPAGLEDDPTLSDYWLVGVCLDQNVYLFDPHYGLPVMTASGDETGGEPDSSPRRQPATLQQLAAKPVLLESLSLPEQPHPLLGKDWSSTRVAVVANSDYWTPKMRRLQASLTGEQSAVIYDSLVDEGGLDGVLTRVRRFSGADWQPEDIELWTYAEEQLAALAEPTDEQADALQRMEAIMDMPLQYAQTQSTPLEVVDRTKGMLKNRVAMLQGKIETAVSQFQSVRYVLNRVPRELIEPQQYLAKERAAHLALFWVGAAQVDLGDCIAGRNTLRQFLKARLNPLPSVESWNAAARLQSLRCVLESGEVDAARRILDEMKPQLPQSLTARVVLRHASGAAVSPVEESPDAASSPAEPADQP